jgi:mannose-6-phosphate isomerase-like protein (cupin superfamily)
MTRSFPLQDAVLHLDEGTMRRQRNEPGFWVDRERAELATGHVITVFSYDEAWDYQEMHPTGDELAVVLEGRTELLLDDDRGEVAIQMSTGKACIVPTGVWHRLAADTPSTVLFVTPAPLRTEHRLLASRSS